MYDVSDRYKASSGYGFAVTLEASIEGRDVTLTYDDLLSFKLSGNGSPDDKLSFGHVAACEVSFSIDNIDGRWDDTQFGDVVWVLKQGKMLSRSESETFQVGIFTTAEAISSDGSINIRAVDNMEKFEVRFKGINFPCTLHDLVVQCCKQVGITFATHSYTNKEFVITGAYQLTQITCRKIISLAAELCGSFAIINAFGELEFRWFDTRYPVATYSADELSGFKPDKITNAVGGTSVVFNGATHVFGSGNKIITLTEDNRLLMYVTPEQIRELLENIYNDKEASMSYSTASFSSIGDPALEVGDVVAVTDRKGKRYNVLVSSLIQSNNLKMEITSPPVTVNDESTTSASESGSIPRDTSESVNVYVVKNERSQLRSGGIIEEFLYQRFSTEQGANPIGMLTLVGTCSSAGVLVIRVVIDGTTLYEYNDTVGIGNYVKTIIFPIQGIISGNHSAFIQLNSFNGLEMIFQNEENSTAGSVMILQGRKMGEATSWDGVITCSDIFGSMAASRGIPRFEARDVFNDIETNDTSGPIICQTITINAVRGDASFESVDGGPTINLR